jgi:hypothetical protein
MKRPVVRLYCRALRFEVWVEFLPHIKRGCSGSSPSTPQHCPRRLTRLVVARYDAGDAVGEESDVAVSIATVVPGTSSSTVEDLVLAEGSGDDTPTSRHPRAIGDPSIAPPPPRGT